MADAEVPDTDESLLERLDDLAEQIEEAAVEAEFETGEREETYEEARRGALFRAGRMAVGTIVTIVGIIALPLPGPGWLIIAGGLTILSKDVAWADRLLRIIRSKVPGIPEDGKIPRSSMITMAFVTSAAVAFSLWWTFGRGSDDFQAGTYDLSESSAAIRLADQGPATVTAEGCDPVQIDTAEVSKDAITFGEASTDCAALDELVDALSGETVELGYSTDGIVKWFFADDYLSSVSAGDTTFDLTPR